MSCGQIALKELGIEVNRYIASEIEPNAIKVTKENFPDTEEIGDVMDFVSKSFIENPRLKEKEIGGIKTYIPTEDIPTIVLNEDKLRELPIIDLVIFGSPCRSLSKATAGRKNYNKGLGGVSWLFYPCNAILQWIKKNNNKDVLFMVENVDSNNKKDLAEISNLLGVEPVMINSSLFSAQDRKRNYWTNIPIHPLPVSCSLVLKDIMDDNVDEKSFYNKSFTYHGDDKKVCATLDLKGHDILKRVNNKNFKSPTLTSCRGGNLQKKVFDNGRCRKLTPNEYRKLQTIPEWYEMNVSNSQIYNMCGDGWTIEVIKHIFNGIKEVID